MKISNPKTNEVFNNLDDAITNFCGSRDCGFDCPLYAGRMCELTVAKNNAQKVVELMGYEVVEEAQK